MNRLAGKSKTSKRPKSNRAFYLDEGVPSHVAAFLRANRCNVEQVSRSRSGNTDIAQLTYASKAERIFLAVDKDASGYTFPARRIIGSHGVIVVTAQPPTNENYEYVLAKLLKFLDGRSIKGKLCLASRSFVRIKEVSE